MPLKRKSAAKSAAAKKAWVTRKKHTSSGKKPSTKGKLLKGMTKNLPAGLFADNHFEGVLEKVMSGNSGVYALYKHGKLYYVGLSKDLYKRMETHRKDRHSGRWDSFKIFKIKNVKYLKDIETLILSIFQPDGNKISGKVPTKYNLTTHFKLALKQLKNHIGTIEKGLR